MRGMRHPITRAMYEMTDGGVVVTHGPRRGVFDSDGRWLEGDKFAVCPNMCGWIGRGPRQPADLSDNRRFRSVVLPKAGDGS